MSLFKLESKIYGAWIVDREDELIANGKTHKFSESYHDQVINNYVGNSSCSKSKPGIKKLLNLKI